VRVRPLDSFEQTGVHGVVQGIPGDPSPKHAGMPAKTQTSFGFVIVAVYSVVSVLAIGFFANVIFAVT